MPHRGALHLVTAAALLVVCMAPIPSSAISPRVWFVDNSGSSGEDGSMASPFDTLAAAEQQSAPGEWIFLFAGDGTTRGQDRGFRLKPGQRLIGESVGLVIDGKTLVSPGPSPSLTNFDGAGIVLADDTMITGLSVRKTTGGGIVGQDVKGTILIDRVIVDGGGVAGLSITNEGSEQLQLEMHGCAIGGVKGDGVAVAASGRSSVTLAMIECALDANSGTAVRGRASERGRLQLDVTQSTLKNGGIGIDLVATDAGTLTSSITKNHTIEGFAGTLINVYLDTTSTPEAAVDARIIGNSSMRKQPGAGFGIRTSCNGEGSMTAIVHNNTIVGGISQDAAIWAEARLGTGRLELELIDNRVEVGPDALNPIVVQSRDGAAVCARIRGNSARTPGAQAGLRIRQRGESTLAVDDLEESQSTPESVQNYLQTANTGLGRVSATADTTYAPAVGGVCFGSS